MKILQHPLLRSKSFFIIGMLVVIYLLVMLSRVVWQNYQVNQQVAVLKSQVEELKASNDDLKAKMLYYQTASYQEKEARSKLGLQKPGEEVVLTPNEGVKVTQPTAAQKKASNPRAWWDFFFGPTS